MGRAKNLAKAKSRKLDSGCRKGSRLVKISIFFYMASFTSSSFLNLANVRISRLRSP